MSSHIGSTLETLIPEIWHLIAYLLDPKSLSSLCQSSKLYLDLIRPTLYRDVRLPESPYPTETLKLLCSDNTLARSVHSLSLISPSPKQKVRETVNGVGRGESHEEPTYLETVLKLSSLKRLTLRGCIFLDANDVDLFIQRVNGRDIPIQELSFWEPLSQKGSFPCHNFPLVGLTKIHWDVKSVSDNPEVVKPVWSILNASKDTIQTINLPFPATTEDTYKPFWKLRFPRLEALHLGLLAANPHEFTQFIIAHNESLEILDLAYLVYRTVQIQVHGIPDRGLSFATHGPESAVLKPASLPKLRAFKGSIPVFLQMVRARMKCLTETLQSLDVVPSGTDGAPEDQIRELLDSLLPNGNPKSLSAVRELNVGLEICVEQPGVSDFHIRVIEDCARVFGESLEIWRDEVQHRIEADDLGSVFRLFPRLRVIHLCATAMGKGADLDDEEAMKIIREYALKLALKCEMLEKVHVSNPWGRSLVKIIRRDENGTHVL